MRRPVRIGLIAERKVDYPDRGVGPADHDSEWLSGEEEDELVGALRDAGYEVLRIPAGKDLAALLEMWGPQCDLFLNRSVGQKREGKVLAAAVLESKGLLYVGSTPWALLVTRDKHIAKFIVRSSGVATPAAVLWREGQEPPDLGSIPYPAIVKPVGESSSIGINASAKVLNPLEAARRAAWVAESYRQPALIESFVEGIDVEVPILVDPNPRALGCVALAIGGRLVEGGDFLTSATIYPAGYGFSHLPEGIDAGPIEAAAVRAASALEIRDYGRIDFRIGSDGTPWFIEASTHPHIQKHSSFNVLAVRRGLSYSAMLDEIVRVALRRHQNSIEHQDRESR